MKALTAVLSSCCRTYLEDELVKARTKKEIRKVCVHGCDMGVRCGVCGLSPGVMKCNCVRVCVWFNVCMCVV